MQKTNYVSEIYMQILMSINIALHVVTGGQGGPVAASPPVPTSKCPTTCIYTYIKHVRIYLRRITCM